MFDASRTVRLLRRLLAGTETAYVKTGEGPGQVRPLARLAPATPTRPCCATMAEQISHECEHHADRDYCTDVLVGYSRQHRYGLLIHDGGSARVQIRYCPWCGHRLGG